MQRNRFWQYIHCKQQVYSFLQIGGDKQEDIEYEDETEEEEKGLGNIRKSVQWVIEITEIQIGVSFFIGKP